jgi:hypothetical protein
MSIKLQDAVNLYYELNGFTKQDGEKQEVILEGILKQKMSLKTKVYLQRLNKIVSDEFNIYEKERIELIKKYGQEKDGFITIEQDNIEEFQKELNVLLSTEVIIDVKNLWSSDLSINNFESIETTEYYPILFNLVDQSNNDG